MNARETLTTATVVLVAAIGGFAIADSLRGCDTTSPTAATTEEAAPTTNAAEEVPPPEEIQNWPQGELQGILTFVDAADCRVREVGLVTGRERSASGLITNCEGFWAPKVGTYVAYAGVSSNGYLRIADLRAPGRDLGQYRQEPGRAPIWSPNGLRLAFCDSPATGIEREVSGPQRALPFCPLAYTPDGELAHAEGRRLAAGGRTLLRAPKPIRYAGFGVDGSIAVVTTGLNTLRYDGGRIVAAAGPPEGWVGGAPAFSPTTCQAAVPGELGVTLIVLACNGELTYRQLPGTSASFSPDGNWVAVAAPQEMVFYSLLEDELDVQLSWPAGAVQLAWRQG